MSVLTQRQQDFVRPRNAELAAVSVAKQFHMQRTLSDLQDENRSLRAENADLKRQLACKVVPNDIPHA